jgi:pyruvate dehydrogenase E2 component (dihydrolipoamide acetyltransferase)
MEEGTFGEWLKRDGDIVERGDSLFVLEGEKSAQDIESLERGILRIPPDGPRPGDTVKVGQVLAFLVEAGELAPFEQTAAPVAPSASVTAAVVVVATGGMTSPPPAGPATRRLARNLQIDLQQVPGSGAGGKVTLDDVCAAAAPTRAKCGPGAARVAISPRARRLAAELGIDYASLRGTGRTGRIRERDIRCVATSTPAATDRAAASLPLSPPASQTPGAIHSLSTIRKTIAVRMLAGVRETAPVTLTTKCDATNLVNLREQFRQVAGEDSVVPAYNDLIVKLTAAALSQHSQLLYQWHEKGIGVPEGMHIAVAVDTEAGLLAPVIRDVDRLTLRQVATTARLLVERGRAGRLTADDLRGGVFTITNLGMYGIDAFTPIINLPQSAILGVGRIVREPAVVGEAIVPRDRMTLSLTVDHRVVDGAPAARFLQTLVQAIETPGPWLMP